MNNIYPNLLNFNLPDIPKKICYFTLSDEYEIYKSGSGGLVSAFFPEGVNLSEYLEHYLSRWCLGDTAINRVTGEKVKVEELINDLKIKVVKIDNDRLTIVPISSEYYRILEIKDNVVFVFPSKEFYHSSNWLMSEVAKLSDIGWSGVGNPLPGEYVINLSEYCSSNVGRERDDENLRYNSISLYTFGVRDFRSYLYTPISKDLLSTDKVSMAGRGLSEIKKKALEQGKVVKGFNGLVPGHLYLIEYSNHKDIYGSPPLTSELRVYLGNTSMISGTSTSVMAILPDPLENPINDIDEGIVHSLRRRYLVETSSSKNSKKPVKTHLFYDLDTKVDDYLSNKKLLESLLSGNCPVLSEKAKVDVPRMLKKGTLSVIKGNSDLIRRSSSYDLGTYFNQFGFPGIKELTTEILRDLVRNYSSFNLLYPLFRKEFLEGLSLEEKKISLMIPMARLFHSSSHSSGRALEKIKERGEGYLKEIGTRLKSGSTFEDIFGDEDFIWKHGGPEYDRNLLYILKDQENPVTIAMNYLFSEVYP